jgi:transposase
VEKTGTKRPWKSQERFPLSHSFNNNKLDDRDHFQQTAKTSVASLRGLIGSSRNIDRHHNGMLIGFIGIPILELLAQHYRHQGAILIQDNASYHKDAEVRRWFNANRHWLEVHQLPAYSPELNPTERLWQYTRQNGTHNRYFANQAELASTLTRGFREMQSYPELIHSYLVPLF